MVLGCQWGTLNDRIIQRLLHSPVCSDPSTVRCGAKHSQAPRIQGEENGARLSWGGMPEDTEPYLKATTSEAKENVTR